MAEPSSTKLSEPHFVGWSNRADATDEVSYNERYFASLAEANAFYDEVGSNGELFAYQGEYGTYSTSRGNKREDFIYYRSNNERWWSELNIRATDPRRNMRGFGRPDSAEYSFADRYVPYDNTDWKR